MRALQYVKRALQAGAAGCLLQAAHAESSVTIYGLIDVGIDHSESGSSKLTRVIPGGAMGSRLGFRGIEDLGGGLNAVFRLEEGLNPDAGTIAQGGIAFGRESSLGLSSARFGTVDFGRLPTPYFTVLPGVDAFQWMGNGGMLALSRNDAKGVRQVLPLALNGRYDNAVGYVSPRWIPGLEFRAIYSLREGSPTAGTGSGASVRYKVAKVDVLAGYGRLRGAAGDGDLAQAVVAGGSYDFGPARVYAGYTREKNACRSCAGPMLRVNGVSATGSSEFRILNLGVRVPFGAFTAIAQAARVQDRTAYAAPTGNRDSTWLAIGAEYAFSRRTVGYASIGRIGNRNGSQYALGAGTAQQAANFVASANQRSTGVAVGMRHSF